MLARPIILMVDDKPANLTALDALLSDFDAELLHATSGEKALELALEHELALILLDVQMPDMDGYETATYLHQNQTTSGTPIIFVTAISQSERLGFKGDSNQYEFRGYDVGAVDFLFKPIDPVILLSKVRVFLELYNKNKALNKQKNELEEFSYIISHDLKSPLNCIKGFSNRLARVLADRLDDREKQQFKRIEANVEHMSDMLNDLLGFIKIGNTGVQKEKFSFSDIAAFVVDSMSVLAAERGIVILLGDFFPVVYGEKNMLTQVLTNLVENAIKYMPEREGAHITVGFDDTKETPEGGKGAFFVKDNGQGILDYLQVGVFKVFNRGEYGNEDHNGTGIGLSAVQRIVQSHGGDVWLESEYGHGACFWFTVGDN
ncbi:MAG: hypothetical protein COA42_06000 [Alteromonadaceae bacterium]|nr:MAG: hypothetical protein COA42_06000 [Alteromonadaceae bacterium]